MAQQLERIVRPVVIVESRPVTRPALSPVTDLATLPPASITWGKPSDFLPIADRQLDGPLVFEWEDLANDPDWSGTTSGGDTLTKAQIPPGDFLDRVRDSISDLEEPIAEETQDPALVYTEIARAVTTVRVENPSDSSQYVDVERIERIVFRGPDGRKHEYRLDHGMAY